MTMTRDELVGHIGDILGPSLGPERAPIMLRHRFKAADDGDLLITALMRLHDQKECIAALEAEVDALIPEFI